MQYPKVEPSRLPTSNIFIKASIPKFKHNTKNGGLAD